MPRIPFAKREALAKAASVLLFACAAAAAAAAPDAGFRPAQVPEPGAVVDHDNPELCARLGGTPEADRRVCSGMDINDTFCLVASRSALPCKGLFLHVIRCNQLNRPALDPFHCAAICQGKKARGARCETVPTPAQVAAVRFTAYFAAEGFTGPAHTITARAGHTLAFAPGETRPGQALNPVPAPDESKWEINITAPLEKNALTITPVATVSCNECYPVSVQFTAVFTPVVAPPQGGPHPAAFGVPLGKVSLIPPDASALGLANPAFADADAADEFTVAADGNITGTPQSDGLKIVRALWTADGMLGALTVLASLNVARSPLPEADAIPPGRRAVSRLLAPGYSGSVAFFAAAKNGVTLQTPPQAPPPFAFPPDESFAAPQGFTVALANPPDAGSAASVRFTVVARAVGRFETTIELQLRASVLSPPPRGGPHPADVGVPLGNVSLISPDAKALGLANAAFADDDADDGFTVAADGNITGTPQSEGLTIVRALWTADGMLGTMTLMAGLNVFRPSSVNPADLDWPPQSFWSAFYTDFIGELGAVSHPLRYPAVHSRDSGGKFSIVRVEGGTTLNFAVENPPGADARIIRGEEAPESDPLNFTIHLEYTHPRLTAPAQARVTAALVFSFGQEHDWEIPRIERNIGIFIALPTRERIAETRTHRFTLDAEVSLSGLGAANAALDEWMTLGREGRAAAFYLARDFSPGERFAAVITLSQHHPRWPAAVPAMLTVSLAAVRRPQILLDLHPQDPRAGRDSLGNWASMMGAAIGAPFNGELVWTEWHAPYEFNPLRRCPLALEQAVAANPSISIEDLSLIWLEDLGDRVESMARIESLA